MFPFMPLNARIKYTRAWQSQSLHNLCDFVQTICQRMRVAVHMPINLVAMANDFTDFESMVLISLVGK